MTAALRVRGEEKERRRGEAGSGLHATAGAEGGGAPPRGEGRRAATACLCCPRPDLAARVRRSPDTASPPTSSEGEREGRGLPRRSGGGPPHRGEEGRRRHRRRRPRVPRQREEEAPPSSPGRERGAAVDGERERHRGLGRDAAASGVGEVGSDV